MATLPKNGPVPTLDLSSPTAASSAQWKDPLAPIPVFGGGTRRESVLGAIAPSANAAYGPTNPSPTPTPSGGGGGGGGNSGAAQQLADIYSGKSTWDDNVIANLKAQIAGGNTDQNKLIDEAYGASSGYLDQAENALRSDYPTILSEIDAQRAAAERTATTGKESTLGTINEQQTLATQRNQNVMADARRLYDELRKGYQQRFGGASSAGQAATELGNLEQQRQMGRTQQDFGNTMRQVEQARTQVEQKFQDQIYQLEQTTNQAKNEANRDFQNKLLQISQSRAENEQAKAQARLSALQDLRNKVYQIDLQNLQFQQTLAQQKQQAELGLSDYANSLSGLGSQATNAVGSFNPNIASNLQTSGGGGVDLANPYVGSIGTNNKDLIGSILPFGVTTTQTRNKLLGL